MPLLMNQNDHIISRLQSTNSSMPPITKIKSKTLSNNANSISNNNGNKVAGTSSGTTFSIKTSKNWVLPPRPKPGRKPSSSVNSFSAENKRSKAKKSASSHNTPQLTKSKTNNCSNIQNNSKFLKNDIVIEKQLLKVTIENSKLKNELSNLLQDLKTLQSTQNETSVSTSQVSSSQSEFSIATSNENSVISTTTNTNLSSNLNSVTNSINGTTSPESLHFDEEDFEPISRKRTHEYLDFDMDHNKSKEFEGSLRLKKVHSNKESLNNEDMLDDVMCLLNIPDELDEEDVVEDNHLLNSQNDFETKSSISFIYSANRSEPAEVPTPFYSNQSSSSLLLTISKQTSDFEEELALTSSNYNSVLDLDLVSSNQMNDAMLTDSQVINTKDEEEEEDENFAEFTFFKQMEQ